MAASFALLAVLVVFAVSLVVIRLGSLALVMTGLSPDVASFQALSAFSGAGFTTEEAEQTVSTPARRNVVKTLIRLGNVGIVTAIFTLVVSFTSGGAGTAVALVVGVLAIVLVARSRWFNRLATPVLKWLLVSVTDLETREYTRLLHMHDEYRVAELAVGEDDWLADATLSELDLPGEGVVVLGILGADGEYEGAPGPDTRIEPGDRVIAYGKASRLRELADRSADDRGLHDRAVAEHSRRRTDAS